MKRKNAKLTKDIYAQLHNHMYKYENSVKAKEIVFCILLFIISICFEGEVFAEKIYIQSSTALRDSGLYSAIIPLFERESGITVVIIAVGSGQALENARNGDADVVITHDEIAENLFINQGYAKKRIAFAYTYYQIIGPKREINKFKVQATSINDAMLQLVDYKKPPTFISRGDNSGTHKKELLLWKEINISPENEQGIDYIISGMGMASTLNLADQLNAYTLSDSASFLALKKNFRIDISFTKKISKLKNIYNIITLNKLRNENARKNVNIFVNWLVSKSVQSKISNFSINGLNPYKGIMNYD